MDRRKFIKNTIYTGMTVSLVTSAGKSIIASMPNSDADVIIVKGGNPETMFDRGIAQLGGLKSLIKKGDNIVVKPDIGTDSFPEEGKTTHPLLVKQIIEHCYDAGAGQVQVFDHTSGHWTKCYKNSGIERIAKDAYARVLPANDERYFTELRSSKPSLLKTVKIHNALLEADLFINVPVLKIDPNTKISASIKNLMGCIWDWDFYLKNDLDQCLAEFLYYKKPQLNIIDAYYTLLGGNTLQTQVISADIVAADLTGTEILGMNPIEIGHIVKASQLGFGELNKGKISFKSINI